MTTSESDTVYRVQPTADERSATQAQAKSNRLPLPFKKKTLKSVFFSLLHALQKTPDLSGAECQGVGITQFHADERGQTARFVAVIEPPVYWGIFIYFDVMILFDPLIRNFLYFLLSASLSITLTI